MLLRQEGWRMGDSKGVSREDIPGIEDIKPAALQVLESGRSRSLASFESETAKRLGLTSAQRAFCVTGSSSALFSNRFEKARSELHRDGMIEYPARGKVRLGDRGQASAKSELETEPDQAPEAGMRAPEGGAAAEPSDESPAMRDKPDAGATSQQATGECGSGSYEGGITSLPSIERSEPKTSSIIALVLAAVGLALSFTGVLSLAGALCGAVSLGFFVHDRRKKPSSSGLTAPKATLALGICSVVLGVMVALGGAASGGVHNEAQQPSSSSVQQEPKTVEAPEEHELDFVVQSDEELAPASVTVIVSGTQTDGVKVSERHEAAVGKTYTLARSPGRYSFEIDASSLAVGEVLLKADRVECSFDGLKDRTVSIKIVQDAEAMQARAAQEEAERQKAEEEAAAAAAAATAEQEAAAAAEREAAAAAAASAADDRGGDTVYLTKTGEKYHRDGCSSLRKSKIPTTRSEAEARGYEPCKNCRP